MLNPRLKINLRLKFKSAIKIYFQAIFPTHVYSRQNLFLINCDCLCNSAFSFWSVFVCFIHSRNCIYAWAYNNLWLLLLNKNYAFYSRFSFWEHIEYRWRNFRCIYVYEGAQLKRDGENWMKKKWRREK